MGVCGLLTAPLARVGLAPQPTGGPPSGPPGFGEGGSAMLPRVNQEALDQNVVSPNRRSYFKDRMQLFDGNSLYRIVLWITTRGRVTDNGHRAEY